MATDNDDDDLFGDVNECNEPAEAAAHAAPAAIAVDTSGTSPSGTARRTGGGKSSGKTSWLRVADIGKSSELLHELEGHLVDPMTGEAIELTDVDGLVDMYERIDHADKILYQVKCEIRKQLLNLSEGDTATRRLRGPTRTVKIELPAVKFEQRVLKAVWYEYPALRDEFLRIENVAVKMTEYKKLRNTACEGDVLAVRDALTRADRGREGLPTVTIEV